MRRSSRARRTNGALHIKEFPQDVKRDLKAIAALKNMTMTDYIVSSLRACVRSERTKSEGVLS